MSAYLHFVRDNLARVQQPSMTDEQVMQALGTW
jgi:hypothetical protein